jgi:hypothetical protein
METQVPITQKMVLKHIPILLRPFMGRHSTAWDGSP